MNKYIEALNILKIVLKPRLTWVDSLVINQYLLLMEELVEKATPKNVIKKYTGYIKNSDDIKFDIYFYYCPNCNVVFEGCDFGCTYCQDCGQAIDWSKEDD